MNIEDNDKMKLLFENGIKTFEEHDFYEAHELWEELWSDYNISDSGFIQGLIQLAVAYFHISNLNKNGAIGLFTKCIPKLEDYMPIYRGIDIKNILIKVEAALQFLKDEDCRIAEFDWSNVPRIRCEI